MSDLIFEVFEPELESLIESIRHAVSLKATGSLLVNGKWSTSTTRRLGELLDDIVLGALEHCAYVVDAITDDQMDALYQNDESYSALVLTAAWEYGSTYNWTE